MSKVIIFNGSPDPKVGEEGIKFANNILKKYGWSLEDTIHYCGTSNDLDLGMLEELSLRAFKAGENLVG